MKRVLVGVFLAIIALWVGQTALPINCDSGCVSLETLCLPSLDVDMIYIDGVYEWEGPSGWCVSEYGPADPKVTYIRAQWTIACGGCR